MISGNYGAFLRNDGANTYFLLTAAGDQYGQWNALRPLYINDASGAVTIGTSLVVGGTIQSTSGGVVFPDGTTQTTAVRGGVSASTQVNCYAPTYGSCTANCPTGYFLSACNQYANPSGNGCASASSNVTITAYCVK